MTEVVEAAAKPHEKRYPLKSVKNGYVKLRRLTHGEANERNDKVLTFVPPTPDDPDSEGTTHISTQRARQHDFALCIVDHNLGTKGVLYNFKHPADVDALDQDIGDEVGDLIQEHNAPIDIVKENDSGNSERSSTPTT